ncbi:MAG TPA: aminomethyltransferase family protein, partial [Stellaceae bacterium]|nr:aminomethyltransferase family protein [Stellaceae bacterium]
DPRNTSAKPVLSFRRSQEWWPLVREEVAAVRERVGLLDLPGFSKFEVSGPGAAAHLDRLVCSRLPRVGRASLAYALTPQGKVLSEFTITRVAPDRFYVVCASTAEWHDHDVLSTHLPADGSVRIDDLTERLGTLIIAGPRSRDVLARVTTADLSTAAFPWLATREIAIGSAAVRALRMTYVGELGWELHAPMQSLPGLYDALWSAGEAEGILDFGIYAVDCLRLDKGYRGWKTDLEIGYSPLEASLDRFVDLAKPDFVGRDAVLEEHRKGPRQRLVPLALDAAGDADAPACASVFLGDATVGLATSGGWSPTLDRSVALAYVRADLAAPGTRLEVEIFGERRAATVGREPLYDPQNLRLRA